MYKVSLPVFQKYGIQKLKQRFGETVDFTDDMVPVVEFENHEKLKEIMDYVEELKPIDRANIIPGLKEYILYMMTNPGKDMICVDLSKYYNVGTNFVLADEIEISNKIEQSIEPAFLIIQGISSGFRFPNGQYGKSPKEPMPITAYLICYNETDASILANFFENYEKTQVVDLPGLTQPLTFGGSNQSIISTWTTLTNNTIGVSPGSATTFNIPASSNVTISVNGAGGSGGV